MGQYRIGSVTQKLGMSADTLRYYEKIGLLPKVTRGGSGARLYDEKDIARLRFIRRAQQMNFTLSEIASLLRMRDAPHKARRQIRELTGHKLAEVDTRLAELKTLRNELQLIINLCTGAKGGCPIIKKIDRS